MDIDGSGSYNNNNNTHYLDAPFTKVLWRLQRMQKYNQLEKQHNQNKHLKNSNAACFHTPIVLKLLIIIQMW